MFKRASQVASKAVRLRTRSLKLCLGDAFVYRAQRLDCFLGANWLFIAPDMSTMERYCCEC